MFATGSLKTALPAPAYPPCLSVDFCRLHSSLTGNSWSLEGPDLCTAGCTGGIFTSLHLWVIPGCLGLLWSHSQPLAVPGILLRQKSSPHSEAEGVKASLTVVLGLLALLCPQEHFLGAMRQWQHQHLVSPRHRNSSYLVGHRGIVVTVHSCGFSSQLCPQPV